MLAGLRDRVRAWLAPAPPGPAEPREIPPDSAQATVPPLRRAVRRSLVPRWVAALRTRIFSTVAAVALAIFGSLTALVSTGLTAGPDLAVTLAMQQAEHPLVSALMVAVSAPGFMPMGALIVAGVCAFLWLAGYRTESLFALVASASYIVTNLVKGLVERPRPDDEVVRVVEAIAGYSFPSGHVLFYVTFFGFIAYAAFALLKPGRVRTAILWLCGLLILLVGPSRIWLGHHWLSDVLASYALGTAYLIILVRLYSAARLRSGAPASG
jgi:membrane-associated phospholipid phosphatase